MAPQLETIDIERLSPQFTGELLRQGDSGYDDARLVWNGLYDRYPGLIARCSSTDDVVAAVNFARDNVLPLSVRGGGHSTVGYGTNDGGIVIDLSTMCRPIGSLTRARPPSSRGLGRRPLTAETGVRIPVAV